MIVASSIVVFGRLLERSTGSKSTEAAWLPGESEAYRWSRVQASLEKVRFPLPWNRDVNDAFEAADDRVKATIIRETHWSWTLAAHVPAIEDQIEKEAERLGEPSDRLEETVIQIVGDRAAPMFRRMWTFFDPQERLALIQLARTGVINAQNEDLVRQMLRVGFVRRSPDLRIASESLRRFVASAETQAQIDLWQSEFSGQDAWSTVRTPFLILLLALGAFVLWAGQDSYERMLSLIPAIGAGLSLLKVFAGPTRLTSSAAAGDGASATA
jgi:hypothetical protein